MALHRLAALAAASSGLLAAGAAGAAERAILADGRELVCVGRQPVAGGWSCRLESGGEAVLASAWVERFELYVEPLPSAPEAPPGPSGVPPVPETQEARFERLIRSISDEFAVDPLLVEAVAWVESRHDPYAVSPKGAAGVMQLMPGTARELAVENPFDLEQNIRGGVRLLRQLLDRMNGNLALVLAAYNAGEGAVARAGGVPAYRETRQYVVAVLERYTAAMSRAAGASQVR